MSRWERVTALFEDARALPPHQRSEFLDRQCAGDDELRAELDSLLAAHDPARTFFDALEASVVGPSVGRLFDESRTIASGTRLGAYEIEERIGDGGMGVVYRARDRRLDRSVALKLIAPELMHDAEARDRLIREARAAAALDDPRICAIHAIEEAPDGRLFLVLPYYTGETLKQRLTRGRLEVDEAIAIATDLAEGLACAHRAGIVHRDIKPANVLVTTDGAVKILDFGIARLTTGTGPTRTGAAPGTVAYMAPEQVRGARAEARSDVWSLGVLLYEMLAGSRPFRGDSEAAVLYAVLEHDPEPLRAHVPDAPVVLERLIKTMISKDLSTRPMDGGEVAEALRQIGSQQHVGGITGTRRAAGSAYGGRAPGHTRRRRIAVACVLAAIIAMAAFVVSRDAPDAGPATDAIAVLPFAVRGDAELEYLGEGLVHLISTKLDGVGDLRAVDPHALLASFATGTGAPDPETGRQVTARFGARAFVLGSVLRIGPGIELSASLYSPDGELQATASAMAKREADLSSAVDELARELVAHRLTDASTPLSGLAAMTTRSLPALRAYLEGEHLLRTGRPAAALTALQSAVALDSTFGLAWYRLARAAGWIGPVALNEDAAARAVRFGGVLPERTRALISAYRVFRMGDPLEAERMYRRILGSYPEDMETLELLGETLFHNNPFFGRPAAEARNPFERALALDPDNRELMVHLMDMAAAEGRASTLDSLTARYLDTEPGDEPPTALHAYAALRTLVLDERSSRDEAIGRLAAVGPDAVFEALVRIGPQLRDPDLTDRLAAILTDPSHASDHRANGYLHRAWVAVARGRWSAAEEYWESAGTIQPGWTLIHRVLAASLAHSPVPHEELDSMRASVMAWAPPAALEDGQHAGDLQALQSYLIGLLDWRVGDETGVAHTIADLAAIPTATRGLAASFAATLEALELTRADRATDALAALDRAEMHMPFHRRARSPLLEQHLGRFLRAEILRSQESEATDEQALRWYAALEDGYFHWGAPFVGPALLGSAQIHERRGRPEEAARLYDRFITLWSDADADLHAWLELARERRDRLRADGS
jgi:serine/threonine-protein kinase